jgi:Zn-dependent protease
MGLLSLLLKDPGLFLMLAIPLLYSVIAHETAHGIVAYWFGDDTAKRRGRLSFNPLVHLDPVGTIMLFIAGFGWAKPVPVDYTKIRPFRSGLIAVSLAGVIANITIAGIALFLIKRGLYGGNTHIATTLYVIVRINIILGAFNLIPIPPLDGSKIVLGMLPKEMQVKFLKFEPYGFPILLILLLTGMLNPVIIGIQNLILQIIGSFV